MIESFFLHSCKCMSAIKSTKEVISVCKYELNANPNDSNGRRVLTAWAEVCVGIRHGTNAVTAAHFSLDHQKKVSEPLSAKDKLAPSSDLLLCEWVFVHTGSILLIPSKHPGYTRERRSERGKKAVTLHTRKCLLVWQAPTYTESLFILSSGCLSSLKRRIIRKHLPSIYRITMSILSSVFLFTRDSRRESVCIYQDSIAPVM